MNSHEILGLALPTNQPKVAFNFLLNSLEHMKGIAEFSTFLFNFQSPWTQEEIDKAVEMVRSYGFDVRYTFNKYEVKGVGQVPFNHIRKDAADLMPEAKFYMLLDDDFTALPELKKSKIAYGDQLVGCLAYMLKYPKCGMIGLENSGNRCNNSGPMPTNTIKPVFQSRCWTGNGLIFRAMPEDDGILFPNGCLDLVGWGEEIVLASYRYFKGYYYAKMLSASCLHYENQTNNKEEADSENKVLCGQSKYNWGHRVAVDNNYKFINENFNPNYSMRTGKYDIVDEEIYQSNGGTPHDQILKNDEYAMLIENVDKLREEIKEFYGIE